MIEIIKGGKIDRYQLTCPKCGCIFQFTEKDIQKGPLPCFSYLICCPCCNRAWHFDMEWLSEYRIED